MTGLQDRRVALLCRLVLGVVFIISALGKLLDPQDFAHAVAAFRLLPVQTVNLFSMALPWVEMICAVLLIVNRKTTAAALILAGLNVVFIVAIVSAMARGLDIDCGCFSLLSKQKAGLSIWLIARDLLLLALCLPILVPHASADNRL
jgi:uncharacterized membrane protein YphA (DoxX/SURF4 family)